MNILLINACVRADSRTRQLADRVLGRLGGAVEELKLESMVPAPLSSGTLASRMALLEKQNFAAPQLHLARQFSQADCIVIAAPFWDLSFPALLKVYLEAVTVCGVTFAYTDAGVPQGLCKAKKLYYVATAGGKFLPDFGYNYVRALAQSLYGIPDCVCFSAEYLDIRGNDAAAILSDAQKQIDSFFSSAQ